VEVQLTLIKRFIALPAPQNGLHIPFVHFELGQIMGIVEWDAYLKVRHICQHDRICQRKDLVAFR
jgi:hypothetical protein